jgi:hypothetical protein
MLQLRSPDVGCAGESRRTSPPGGRGGGRAPPALRGRACAFSIRAYKSMHRDAPPPPVQGPAARPCGAHARRVPRGGGPSRAAGGRGAASRRAEFQAAASAATALAIRGCSTPRAAPGLKRQSACISKARGGVGQGAGAAGRRRRRAPERAAQKASAPRTKASAPRKRARQGVWAGPAHADAAWVARASPGAESGGRGQRGSMRARLQTAVDRARSRPQETRKIRRRHTRPREPEEAPGSAAGRGARRSER